MSRRVVKRMRAQPIRKLRRWAAENPSLWSVTFGVRMGLVWLILGAINRLGTPALLIGALISTVVAIPIAYVWILRESEKILGSKE